MVANAAQRTRRTTDIHRGAAFFFVELFDAAQVSDPEFRPPITSVNSSGQAQQKLIVAILLANKKKLPSNKKPGKICRAGCLVLQNFNFVLCCESQHLPVYLRRAPAWLHRK